MVWLQAFGGLKLRLQKSEKCLYAQAPDFANAPVAIQDQPAR
jgi:hypothetical protein